MKKIIAITLLSIVMILILMKCMNQYQSSVPCTNVQAGQSFYFFIITDPHYISKIIHDDGEAFQNFIKAGDKLVQYSGEIFDELQKEVILNKPNFLIIAGDLTCNGERKSHIEFSNRLENIEKNGTSVFVIPGNHDINNQNAKNYFGIYSTKEENIDEDEFEKIYKHYGYEEAISKDSNSLSYLVAPSEDNWLLMLDTTNNSDLCGELNQGTLDWILTCSALAKEEDVKLIAVMHHNLIDHSNLIHEDYTIKNSEEALNILYQSDITIALTGHIHIQDIEIHKQGNEAIYDIATSSLSVYPHQYGTIEYCPNNGYDYYTTKLNIDQYINEKDLYNFFILQCCKEQLKCIEMLDKLTSDEKKEVFDVISKMNQLYFSGYRNEKLKELTNSQGFKLLEKVSPCFIKDYVISMLEDDIEDNNKIHINKN